MVGILQNSICYTISMKPTTIYLIRHGEYQVEDTANLSENGRIQAEDLANILAVKNIDIIISSPVSRAVRTAQPLAKKLGLSIKEDISFAEYQSSDESWDDALERTQKGLEKVIALHEGKTVAIVTHGFMIGNFLIKIGYGSSVELAIDTVKAGSFVKLLCQDGEYTVMDTYRIEKIKT